MGEWGTSRSTANPSRDRRVYVDYLREVHDEAGFRLACIDALAPPEEEIEELVYEAEMLANYGVV